MHRFNGCVQGLALAAIVERVHVEDVVLVHPRHRAAGVLTLADLPPGSVVGTSSLRRRALLARLHPHVRLSSY
jgi:hydroxymethylbilane synthase